MKNLVKRYGGLIFFYLAIVSTVWIVSMRFNYLSDIKNENLVYIEETR